jgi:hypothetical protein
MQLLRNIGRMLAAQVMLVASAWLYWWQQQHWLWDDSYPEPQCYKAFNDPTSDWLLFGALILSLACVIAMCKLLYKPGHGGKLALVVISYMFFWSIIADQGWPAETGVRLILLLIVIGLVLLSMVVATFILPYVRVRRPTVRMPRL